MCLVVLAVNQDPDYPLILAANRDEFHARPSQDLHWWPDQPDVVGGRDLQAGGTWLALSRRGRFATVTNYRDAEPPSGRYVSRGELVTGFLSSEQSPHEYLETIDEGVYAGFNLIVGDGESVGYLSNREDGRRELGDGIYGLSNALLDADAHKVTTSKRHLADLIARDGVNTSMLLRLMHDRHRAPAADVETGRLDFSRAHAITAPFIVMPDYGTRCTTIVLLDRDGRWQITERRFDPDGMTRGESAFSFVQKT